MGNSFCSDSDTIQTTQEYLGSLADITPKNGVSGGSVNDCNKYGGLENYANSVPSKSKEYLIRSIAKHATDVLKIKANVSQDGDLLDIIEKLKKVLPDPSNGRNIKTDSKVHKDVCKKLGTAINKAFDNNVVNLNESSESICLKVSQVLNSLTSGLNNEFVGVSNDISKIVKNLNVLQDHMDNIYKKLSNETPNSSMIEDLYKSISKEIKKQHAHLAGLVNGVIGPTRISLINLLESGEMPGLSSDMKAIAGTRAFSDRISHTLYNSGNVSHAAYLVNDALKQIGMSLNEYKNANSLKKLNSNMFDNMVKNKPSSNEINKMISAYTILLNNDLSHDDIVDYLSKKGGFNIYGGDDVLDELNSESFAELIGENLYDDYDSAFKGRKHADKKSIGRTLRKRAIFREKLFSTLNEQIKSKYTTIIMNLYKIGKKLGSEIKISNNIRMFIKQLDYFEKTQPDRYNLHKALSGYRTDVKSEYIKHDFIKALELVVNISAICDAEVGGGYFKDITNSINGLLKVVDDFNATFTKSLTEIHVDADRSATGGDTFGGVAESEFKYLVTMKKAIRELEWYFKISNIKGSLKVAASQQKNYTADYENILGEECGILIDKINETFKLLTCENLNELEYSNKTGAIDIEPTKCVIHTYFNKNFTKKTEEERKKIWDAYVFLMEYMRSANVDMIEAAQAIDLYLSAFTEQAQTNPDEIKDFLKMLEQLEIVAKWFTDKSGDNLAFVFESFGDTYQLTNTNPKINSHYYKVLNDDGKTPAVHDDGITITDKATVKEFIIRLEKSFKSMRALENIISTFSKINISSKNAVNPIMSPGLIFKAFTKYAIASSIGIMKKTSGANSFYDIFKTLTKPDDFNIYLMDTNDKVCNPLYIGDITTTDGNKKYIQPIEIFEMCIKSMVSKVAIVVGIYALFQKPAHGFINNNSLANSPLRQILGGSTTPKIIPEAVELYVRLTLLGEWYRDLFQFNTLAVITSASTSSATANELLISMIPSFDGIWNKFIKVIFVDAAGVKDGGYTESFSIDIVESINDIYTHYKSKYGSDICIKIMENFVAEINLRYGIIKQDEINNYIADKDRGMIDSNEYDSIDNVNFDILDADKQFGRNKVPSDKFVKSTYKNLKKTGLLYKNFKSQIDNFRTKVADGLKLDITKSLGSKFGDLGLQHASVDDLIIQTKSRVNSADDDSKKFKVIQTTIMGTDAYSNIDYDVMLMFHETVINPLTILYTVYKIINQWNKFAIGCLEKYTPEADVKALMRGSVYPYDSAKITDLYIEYGFKITTVKSKPEIITRALQHLFYLTCDKNPLVEMYFSNSGKYKYPMLSFKKLEEYVIPLVECVEKSLNKFRTLLPHDIIKKYENNMDSAVTNNDAIDKSTNVVSLFFIKEHLIDRLIKNKYGGGLNDSNTFLMKSWGDETKGDNYYEAFKDSLFSFDSALVISRDLFTNFMKYPISQIGVEVPSSATDGKSLIKKILDADSILSIQHPLIKGAGMGFMNIYDYDDWDIRDSYKIGVAEGKDGNNGLIFKFNRLIFHYINMFIDSSSGKIYLPLLEKFANGINAGEIMRGNALDDITEVKGNPEKPKFTEADVMFSEKSVIFATQAAAIKNLVTFKTSSSSTPVLKFAEPNLLNVSEYMKDLMTAYLPIFEKHLNLIIGRADMLRTVLEQSRFNLNGNIPDTVISDTGVPGYAQSLMNGKTTSDSECKSYFINVLSYLGSSAKSLQKCVRDSYKELNDLPIYFETYKNSISDYKNRNNILPFMPLSHVSHLLNNNIRIADVVKPGTRAAPTPAATIAKARTTDMTGIYGKYTKENDIFKANNTETEEKKITTLETNLKSALVQTMVAQEKEYTDGLETIITTSRLCITNYKQKAAKLIEVNAFITGSTIPNLGYAASDAENKKFDTYTTLGVGAGGIIQSDVDMKELTDLVQKSIAADAAITNVNPRVAVPNYDTEFKTAIDKLANGLGDLQNYTESNNLDAFITNLNISYCDKELGQIAASNTVNTNKVADPIVINNVDANSTVEFNAVKPIMRKIYDNAVVYNIKNTAIKKLIGEIKALNMDKDDHTKQIAGKLAEVVGIKDELSKYITDIRAVYASLSVSITAFNTKHTPALVAIDAIVGELDKIDTKHTTNKATIDPLKIRFAKIITSSHAAYTSYKELVTLASEADKINREKRPGIIDNNYSTMYEIINGTSEKEVRDKANLLNIRNRNKFNDLFYSNAAKNTLKPEYTYVQGTEQTTANNSTKYGGAFTHNSYYSYKGLIPHRRVGVGSDEFKFAYGTRGLLSDNNEPNIELAPGVIETLNIYNSKMGGPASYDKRHMVDCFKYSTYLLRYAVDYIYHKTYLCDEEIDKATEFFEIKGTVTDAGGTAVNNILHNLSCQTGKHAFGAKDAEFFIKTQNITLLLENDSYKHSLQKMMECITTTSSKIPDNRKDLRIYNILDANIVPINFHALQREIPLINLFNYSHTFDLLVKELNKGIEGTPSFTINTLVKHLTEPFAAVTNLDSVRPIMLGNDGLELNRPKYLSDQLWGKVLLHEVISDKTLIHNASRMNSASKHASYINKSDSKHKFTMSSVSTGLTGWDDIGKERYNTRIVRYMEWFVHLQRYMRYIMRNQLAWVSDPVANRNNAITESITEYEGNRIFDLQEFQ